MINKDNFFLSTFAEFTQCAKPIRKPDYISESGSQYWYTQNGVIRNSDHWNCKIASCVWILNEGETGFCKFSEFVEIWFLDAMDVSRNSDFRFNPDDAICCIEFVKSYCEYSDEENYHSVISNKNPDIYVFSKEQEIECLKSNRELNIDNENLVCSCCNENLYRKNVYRFNKRVYKHNDLDFLHSKDQYCESCLIDYRQGKDIKLKFKENNIETLIENL